MNNLLKSFLILIATTSLLVGCSSTSTQDEEPVEEPTASEPEPEPEPQPEPAPSVDTVFHFEFDKSTLNADARAALTVHAERLQNNRDRVRVEGHTDERGSREYNMGLGERRAKAVRDFLVLQGVSSSRIEVVSYGEERPVARGSNERAWAQNRRAVLEVQ